VPDETREVYRRGDDERGLSYLLDKWLHLLGYLRIQQSDTAVFPISTALIWKVWMHDRVTHDLVTQRHQIFNQFMSTIST
jgi:hypothetical protein